MDPLRGERISKLKQHPAWPDLCDEVEDVVRVHWESVLRKHKAGIEVPLDEIALNRAEFKGMFAVLDMPDRGRKAIERHIEKGEVSKA